VARTAVIPIGLDEADVFVDFAIGALDSGGAKEHLVSLSSDRASALTRNNHLPLGRNAR
jgi:hypothetical protein